jgi:hypothetical protein
MELSTGILYKMLLRMQQLCENQFGDSITLLWQINDFLHLPYLQTHLGKSWDNNSPQKSSHELQVLSNGAVKATLYLTF